MHEPKADRGGGTNIWTARNDRPAPVLDDDQEGWFDRKVKQRAQEAYRRYFVELVLRRKPLPPSKDGRHVPLRAIHDKPLVDERRNHAYIGNTIRSARYTVWDFLPKQLLFQATRLSNFYFICIGVPQTIPGLSTTGSYTTILPLLFFIILTVLKEGYDDYRRHRLDNVENSRLATILREREEHGPIVTESIFQTLSNTMVSPSWGRKASFREVFEEETEDDEEFQWSKIKWRNIKVGDIVRLKRDDSVPADVILLSASGEGGVAYIETMALDGETNLKCKQSLRALQDCRSIRGIRGCPADFVLEDPNRDLYDFNGRVTVDGATIPLTLNEVIYRGSVLRNTDFATGIVVNTGEECKIRMNANHHPKAKKPRLERYANQVVLTLIVYVVLLSVGVSMGYVIWHRNFEVNAWYLNNAYVSFKQIIIGFLIMFNNVIPLALYISLEIVKIGQMIMVHSDVGMYDEDSNTPMTCNTNTILENLGQVSYVLSDKTGTLTENVMKFQKMSIAGIAFSHEEDGEKTERIRFAVYGEIKPQDKTSFAVENRELFASTTTEESVRIVTVGPAEGKQNTLSVRNLPPTITEAELQQLFPPYQIRESRMLRQDEHRTALVGFHHEDDMQKILSTFHNRTITPQRLSPESAAPGMRSTDLVKHIHDHPSSALAQKARRFILALALCHTALPETQTDGQIGFQASSPDEIALVQAAHEMGILLVQRSAQSITLLESDDKRSVYEILNVIDFSSKRKRMSVIVRCPDGRIWLLCKGADSVIVPRLRQADVATRKSHEVRRSIQIEREHHRRSKQHEPRNSFGARPSLTVRGRSSLDIRLDPVGVFKPGHELMMHTRSLDSPAIEDISVDEATIFSRCFRHLDDFATEGLRTLLFAEKYLTDQEYAGWEKLYTDATTSLTNRQERIETVGDMIEQGFDLLGASAIEDKLQKGVPETIDKLRRANIKIWMLTGDKRETAINIAHSARICRPDSDLVVLDSTKGDLDEQLRDLYEEVRSRSTHTVAVIDGHTLAVIDEDPTLKHAFYILIPFLDSVICCRASPAQKAGIVKAIRALVHGALTLAIGDGANDIAMIQASHVGVGISGKEGLQAARVADYSIAQFRFLQRLLLVHGRWNYVRTAKFVLWTFWKEMFFYMMQALYQRSNGYTGTSLYENWSLTVLNTLFTSLCVIVPGIFEQDLKAETLLAIPELYTYGQRNKGLNLPDYALWMILATAEGMIVWFVSWAAFGAFNRMGDNGLFALGDLSFSLGIVWTNYKLLIVETHYKSIIVGVSCTITISGWWAWNGFMSAVYSDNLSPYDVRGGFTKTFGNDWTWWLTLIIAFAILAVMELAYKSVRGYLLVVGMWPPWMRTFRRRGRNRTAEELDVSVWQEMEKDPVIRGRLRELAGW